MRDRRLQILREILQTEDVRNQDELVQALARQNILVTQSSICRDLRELQVAKRAGRYCLPEPQLTDAADSTPFADLAPLFRSALPAGPHLLVVRCVPGGASRVGLAIDTAGWPEVVGTVAGDDTLFVATTGLRATTHVAERLQALFRIHSHV
jgi:transcriptional regulator of arginine metabolism